MDFAYETPPGALAPDVFNYFLTVFRAHDARTCAYLINEENVS